MKAKRLFLIVLDSCGAGALPDAAEFGDAGTNTILSVSGSKNFKIDNLRRMGYGNIEGLGFLGKTDGEACDTRADLLALEDSVLDVVIYVGIADYGACDALVKE